VDGGGGAATSSRAWTRACSGTWVRARDRLASPAVPCSANRATQRSTVGADTPHCAATSPRARPCPRSSTIRARAAMTGGMSDAASSARSSARCSLDCSTHTLMPYPMLRVTRQAHRPTGRRRGTARQPTKRIYRGAPTGDRSTPGLTCGNTRRRLEVASSSRAKKCPLTCGNTSQVRAPGGAPRRSVHATQAADLRSFKITMEWTFPTADARRHTPPSVPHGVLCPAQPSMPRQRHLICGFGGSSPRRRTRSGPRLKRSELGIFVLNHDGDDERTSLSAWPRSCPLPGRSRSRPAAATVRGARRCARPCPAARR
jgi:hypothetical protein